MEIIIMATPTQAAWIKTWHRCRNEFLIGGAHVARWGLTRTDYYRISKILRGRGLHTRELQCSWEVRL
jgi:hypothetical protein